MFFTCLKLEAWKPQTVKRFCFAWAAAAGTVTLLLGSPESLAQGIGNDPVVGGQQSDPTGNLPRAGTSIDNGPQPGDAPAGGGDDGAKDAAPPPPPALPGSHAQPTTVAPADKVVADMDPTTALFDAINRGDTPAARDAVGRGANLDGQNVLGLTPIELSVDLGRNDISFLLLSMHNEAGDVTQADVKAVGAVATSAPHSGHVVRARHVANTVTPQPANIVGASSPDNGFLGFGKRGS